MRWPSCAVWLRCEGDQHAHLSLPRGLALGKSNTVGVITQAIDSPFYGEGLRGIEDYLQQRGYTALFMSGNWNEEDEERCMSELLSRVGDLSDLEQLQKLLLNPEDAAKVPLILGKKIETEVVYYEG